MEIFYINNGGRQNLGHFLCKGVIPPVETRLGAFKEMNWTTSETQVDFPKAAGLMG